MIFYCALANPLLQSCMHAVTTFLGDQLFLNTSVFIKQ